MAFLDDTGLGYFISKLKNLIGNKNGIAPLGAAGTVEAAYLPNMTGATASANGESGIVPAPSAGDQVKYLKGNAKWTQIAAADVSLPASAVGAQYTNVYTAMLYVKGQLDQHPIVYTNSSGNLVASQYPEGTIWLKQKS